MTDRIVSTIRKNATEEYRVSLTKFNGYDLATVRVWFTPGGNATEMRPGRQGVAVRLELLPELIGALRKAEDEARADGLMKGREAVEA